MSMAHKAYAFDWKAFEIDELSTLLVQALESDDTSSLIRYIESHRDSLKDPDEGDPLDENWREMLGQDVHTYGDFALTRFYNPAENMGLSGEWIEIDDLLPESSCHILLGFSISSSSNVFDPGRMGSYFQTPEQVMESLAIVRKLEIPYIEPFQELL